MAALGRFISRLGERALPFFVIMKRSGTFKWTPEAAAAFEDLKRYLASPPIMVSPQPHEPLLLLSDSWVLSYPGSSTGLKTSLSTKSLRWPERTR